MTDRSAARTASDAALIARVRLGDAAAFDLVTRRHRAALHDLGVILTPTPEALVERTLATAYSALRRARGPRTWMRGYLLDLTIRLHTTSTSQPPRAGHAEIGRAYAGLADAWQAVLWHRLAEQETSTEVATVIGVSRDQVDALVGSARTDLRRSLLARRWQQALPAPCRAHTGRLLEARPATIPRSMLRHAARCSSCCDVVEDLNAVQESLPEVLAGHVLADVGDDYLATRRLSARERLSTF